MTKQEKHAIIDRGGKIVTGAAAERFAYAYGKSTAAELWQVYDRCSDAKREAFDRIRRRVYNDDFRDLRIISHNSFSYSVGYIDLARNILYAETRDNLYAIPLDTFTLLHYVRGEF